LTNNKRDMFFRSMKI